jgi:hypothetical protein
MPIRVCYWRPTREIDVQYWRRLAARPGPCKKNVNKQPTCNPCLRPPICLSYLLCITKRYHVASPFPFMGPFDRPIQWFNHWANVFYCINPRKGVQKKLQTSMVTSNNKTSNEGTGSHQMDYYNPVCKQKSHTLRSSGFSSGKIGESGPSFQE